ncbi:glycosyl transferase, group 1 family protein, putative [Heliomicrobium modesticaldum Ice1]|uniref:Glycosyl transferase, group 1 family protein, putative n=1 Tax=Heliobacterium modesticaldum (strain ATCC 51547 / Ice1) TaxID=498761 RepID=B0TGA2_HELMI|nr:N-acetyl-alpha-D-glucosaminyl L-malate synthase BshA [Heliomicrobium modesticaldum]ABZ84598.1 glycosyl transferase, group 1 family protein, putative [Heliomicrobium modesticaldum Ice1]
MNIGIVCYPSYGGSGVVASELARQLGRRGHRVHVFSYETPFRLAHFEANVFFHEVEAPDYPLFRFPPYLLALSSKIVEVTREAELQVIHVHYAVPHTAAAYLAKQMLAGERRLPVLTTMHGTDITLVGNDPQFYEITRFSLEASDGVTAVSRSLAEESAETFRLRRLPRVIPNFVDTEEYRPRNNPALRARFARPDEKILLHISNMRPVKRVEDVIRIFARVNEQAPCRLLLAGDGPERLAAAHLAEALGLQERICFLGRQDNVAEIFPLADLFLLPSAKESFGLVALEAMACQVPVIASDTGGLPEVIEQGVTGYLAPVGDVETMAGYAISLLTNEREYAVMARQAREAAVNRFRAEPIIDAYEAYYGEILNTP